MTIRKGTIQMTRLKTNLNFCLGLGALLLLAGCASEPKEFEYKNLTEEVEAIKADGGIYKVGNPYTVMGQSYTPREDYGYVETGMASWYGDDFHNKRTANGETYDMRAVTAAHRTLPLPSIVRVTNLENGRSIIARVNDRGPYVKNRIIDLSEKGAELLGYKNKGVTKVKVEVLERESRAIKEAMLSPSNSSATYGNQTIPYSNTQTAMAATPAAGTAATKPAAKSAKYEISTSQQRQPLKYTSEISLASNASAAAVNVPESAGEGPFFVQVGAFADYDKARQMADNMKRFGNVSIYEAYLSKNGVYRVRLGAYPNRGEAMKILDRVLDYGHSDVTIVEKD